MMWFGSRMCATVILPQTGRQSGFTLLELLVVLAIITMVATAIPFVSTGGGTELHGLGYELAAELSDLRESAIRGHVVTEFSLEPQISGYRIGHETSALPPGVTLNY